MTTIEVNKKEEEVIKKALDIYKFTIRVKTYNDNLKKKEDAINELYNVESVEKKLGVKK